MESRRCLHSGGPDIAEYCSEVSGVESRRCLPSGVLDGAEMWCLHSGGPDGA